MTVYIEVEAESRDAARDAVYRELDSRPAVGPADPLRYIDVADSVECDAEPDEDTTPATISPEG